MKSATRLSSLEPRASISRARGQKPSQRTVNRNVITLAVLLLMQVVFLSSTYLTWGSDGLIGLVIVMAMVGRYLYAPMPSTSDEPSGVKLFWQYLITFLGLLTVFVASFLVRMPQSIGESGSYVSLGIDVLAHTSFYSSLFLWCFHPRRGHVLMLFFGLAMVALCVASGGISRSLSAQTTVGILSCVGFLLASRIVIPSRKTKYRLAVGKQAYREDGLSSQRRDRLSKKRFRSLFAVAVLLMMATGAAANVVTQFLPYAQQIVQEQLEATMVKADNRVLIGGLRYVRGSELGSIRKHLVSDPEGIALYVGSKQEPGYLRGTIFDVYRSRRWDSETPLSNDRFANQSGMARRFIRASNQKAKTTRLLRPLDRSWNHFNLTNVTDQKVVTIEITGQPFRGNDIFLPLASQWVEAAGSELMVDHHGKIRSGIDNSQPYAVGVSQMPAQEKLEGRRRMVALWIEPRQRSALIQLASEVCKNARTPREKGDAISEYFAENFSYSLEAFRVPRNEDPIVYFLKQQPPAHCEYFAGATALLLRAVGVPTRYVTGYVTDEPHDRYYQVGWVARNRDAHAWVEAYDDESQRWFPVESTPGRTYYSLNARGEENRTFNGSFEDEVGQEDIATGWLRRTWGALLSVRATDAIYDAFRYGQMVVLVGLVLWLVRRYRGGNSPGMTADDLRSRRLLAKVDRKIRRLGYIRSLDESLYRFADRIESESAQDRKPENQSIIKDTAVWLRAYADARYQGQRAPNWGTTNEPSNVAGT